MVAESDFSRLLATLYAAPVQPEMWNIFLRHLSTLTGVNKAALIAHDAPNAKHRILAFLGESIGERENVAKYESHYYKFDEWTMRAPAKALIETSVFRGEELWPAMAFRKSVFYNEFLLRVDVRQMMCLGSVGAPGIFEALSIYRGQSEEDFDQEQRIILQTVAPHLRMALLTRRKLQQLESRVSDLEMALDCMGNALVLIDRDGKAVFINKSARRILDRGEGISLLKGRLVAQEAGDGRRLREVLARAIGAANGDIFSAPGAIHISRPNKMPLRVVAGPLRFETHGVSDRAAAVVFITDPEGKANPAAELLRILFGLTPAEVRLADCLLQGKSLWEAAELNQVGRETVRTQIKSVFSKTGARRQADLIRLLASISVPHEADRVRTRWGNSG
jgi:DNA-binding CsgD family transcriptional regulator/PAS domain-containing protein